MTGHREPPPEWIPLIAAIVQIDDVQIAFGSALTMQIELETGRRVLWDSFPNEMVGPDSAVTFLLSGFHVIATAQGRLTTVLDNKADHAFGEMAARAVKTARIVAGLAVARLVTDGYYKAHGRHETLRSPPEPIPGDLVYAKAVSFDICTGIASYSDGAKAQIVHLERTNKPTFAQVVLGLSEYLENAKAPCPEPVEPRECDTGNEADEEGFKAWLSAIYDGSPEKRTKTIKQINEYALTNFKVQESRAEELRASIFALRGLEFRNAWSKGGRPRGFEK
jgi:hypothetical protein